MISTNTDTAIALKTDNLVQTQSLFNISTTSTDPVDTTLSLYTNPNAVVIEPLPAMLPVHNKLEAVHQDLQTQGLFNELSGFQGELKTIGDFIKQPDLLNQKFFLKNTILISKLPLINRILSNLHWKSAYKPLIKVLFEQELGKFEDSELEDGAVIMHTLMKIEKICGSEIESVLTALTVILNELSNCVQQPCDIAAACQLISQHCENSTNPVDLIQLLYDDSNLNLEDPFECDVDDDSSEERGFFASIKHNVVYAFFHPIEFVQETIWGKKKVHRSSDDGIEEKHTEAAENEHDDHSKSYFEPIKNIFAWIPYFGSFFSTRNETKENKHEVALNLQDNDTQDNETKENKHEVALILQDNDTQEDKRKVALNLQDIEKSTKANNLAIKIMDQLEEGKLYDPLDIPKKLTQEMLELMSIDIIKKINEELTTLKRTNNNQDLINLINLCSTVLDNKGNESDYSEDEDCDTLGSDSNL